MSPTLVENTTVYFLAEAPGCFLAGTPLFTQKNTSFIEEIQIRKSTLDGGLVLRDLEFLVEDYPAIKFRPKKYPEYTCTSNHQLLVASKEKYLRSGVTVGLGAPEFITADKLVGSKGRQYLCVPKIKNVSLGTHMDVYPFKRNRCGYNDVHISDRIDVDADVAFILGMFMGDGTASKDGVSWCLSVGFKEQFLERLKATISRFTKTNVVRKHDKRITLTACSRTLAELFRHHFYDKNGEKIVPKAILNSSPIIISNFLFGWFVTDGKKGNIGNPKGVLITTTSNVAAWQGVFLGLKCGVLLGVRPEKPNRKAPAHYKTCYNLTFDNTAIEKLNWPLEIHQGVRSPNFGEDDKYFYLPISYAKATTYTGKVYDKTTTTHQYQIPFTVHNSHEDEVSHRPLTGPSGKLLRECIPSELNGKCSFDNCVRDRPEGNRTPTWVEIECCRGYVTASIEKAKPKLIVGLGAVTLQWVLKTVDLQGLRGRFFAVKVGTHSCYFLPTYHPSFVLRIAFNKKKPLNSKMGHCFRMDIERACNKAPLLEAPKIDSESEVRGNVYIFDGK